MMISGIIDLSTVLMMATFLSTAICTEQNKTPLKLKESLYLEFKSVFEAIKAADPTVTFEMDRRVNKVSQAITMITEHDTVDFNDQKLAKLPIHAMAYMERIKSMKLKFYKGFSITTADVEMLKRKGLTELYLKEDERFIAIKYLARFLKIPSLKKLVASGCDLSSLQIFQLYDFGSAEINIEYLSVADCNIDFYGFKTITTLFKRLTRLDISCRNFIKDPARPNEHYDFGGLKKTLKELKLYRIKLDHEWLKAIGDLECLEDLYIAGNPDDMFKMTKDKIIGFGNLKKTLKTLQLDFDGINEKWLEEICKLGKLETIHFYSIWHILWGLCPSFSEKIFKQLAASKTLRTVIFHPAYIGSAEKQRIRNKLPGINVIFEEN